MTCGEVQGIRLTFEVTYTLLEVLDAYQSLDPRNLADTRWQGGANGSGDICVRYLRRDERRPHLIRLPDVAHEGERALFRPSLAH